MMIIDVVAFALSVLFYSIIQTLAHHIIGSSSSIRTIVRDAVYCCCCRLPFLCSFKYVGLDDKRQQTATIDSCQMTDACAHNHMMTNERNVTSRDR